MNTLPLLGHASLDDILAWRPSGPVRVREFLADVDALAALGTQIKVLFPAGTETGDTDALPLIWQEQEKFAQLLKASEKSTAELRTAVAAGDKAATMQAFKAVGESCKGCHDRYREKDD